MKIIDMTGHRFGAVIAMLQQPITSSRKAKWMCRCDCAREFIVCGGKLRSGEVVTCPTCSRERAGRSRITHGARHTSEYRIWTHIKSRCFNEKVPEFWHYGGRGISVCPRWRESFAAFFADMGQRPTPEHSIDRFPNNDGNYEPGNCRWATPKEQGNNTRVNRKVSIGAETRNVSEWADSIGVRRGVIFKRLNRGITGSRLIAKPFEPETVAFRGVSASIREWSERTGIKRATLYWRINTQNWPLERALTEGAMP